MIKNLNAERAQARTKESLTNGDQDQEQDQGFLEKSPYFRKWDFVLDTSKTGPHYLIQPSIAEIIVEALHYRHMQVYYLFAYCIMSNHVHVVFKPLKRAEGEFYQLNRIMQSLKRHTARKSNRVLGTEGKFWQAESYDHVIRDDKELNRIIHYVITNPLNFRLVSKWEDWPWTYVQDEYNPFK